MKSAAPQTIDFDAIPEVGTVVMFRGQRYEMVGVRPHTNRAGEATTLICWATHCARCADPVEVTTTLRGHPSRRCQACKQPGVPTHNPAEQIGARG